MKKEAELTTTASSNAQTHCLVLEGVSKAFAGLQAVDNVSFSVEHGARRVIIGPNGAGKTTLFNLISGALDPTGGRITYRGTDITHMAVHRRTALGITRTFQITNLFPNLTVSRNLVIACLALERTKFMMFRPVSSYGHLQERATELLQEFDLWKKRDELIKNLSHGDQRQIEVAMALAGQPRLLLLDEPTAGLSPAETRDLTRLLKKLDPAITILMIEHDMDVAFDFGDTITVLCQGQKLAEGNREEVRNNPMVQQIYLGAGC
jgi:branched-chain amino acid transport system ATP-binding protein